MSVAKPSAKTLADIDKIMTQPPRVQGKRGPKTKLPRMTVVESTNLRSCSWSNGLLFVRFKDNSVYRYGGATNPVPKFVFDELLGASADEESVGRIFRDRVKDSYPCVKLWRKKPSICFCSLRSGSACCFLSCGRGSNPKTKETLVQITLIEDNPASVTVTVRDEIGNEFTVKRSYLRKSLDQWHLLSDRAMLLRQVHRARLQSQIRKNYDALIVPNRDTELEMEARDYY
jgi:KTSC domain